MKLERTKNTVRGISTGLVNKIITLLLPFLVRTVLIQKIGIEYAGLNGLFVSILQVLNLTELGFSNAIVHSMYKPIAEDDEETICALLNFYRKVYFIIGLIILGIGLAIMPFLTKLINGTYPSNINIYILYFIYLLNTSISYLFFGYKNSIMNAFQRVDIINNISTLTSVFLNVTQIALLIVTKSYYLYVIVMPVCTILNNLIVAYEVKKYFPQYVCKGTIPAEIKKDMKKKVSGLMIQKVCATTRNTLDSIFISAFLGLTMTAMYSNYYYIMNAVTGFMGIITTSMLGGIGNGIQVESKEVNYSNMRKFNFMYMWISGWFTAAMLCLYQPFMKLWMGQEYMLDFNVVILLCVYFYILKIGDIRSVYYSAVGLWWEGKWRAVMEVLLNVALNFFLVQLIGVYGIILATLTSLFFINFLHGSRYVFKYYFGMEKVKEYYLLHGLYFAITVLCSFLTYYSCSFLVEVLKVNNNLASFFIKGIVCTVVPNIFLLIIYFKTNDFKNMIQWMKEHKKA